MGLFTKKTELETLQGQQEKLQGKEQELQAKITKIANGLVVAETNLMIDESAANKKQVEKFKSALEKTQKELEAVGAETSEVASRIGEIHAEEKKAEINEAAKAYEERAYRSKKMYMMKAEAEKLVDVLYRKTGLVSPDELKSLVGLRYGEYFDPANPEHTPFIETANKASSKGQARAEKEFAELLVEIEKFLELN